jgi:O-antigen ligase/Flp pilus assembly protein TadD
MNSGRTVAPADPWIEAPTLVTLAALPAYINLASLRIFEEEKALLLRAAALVAVAAMAASWRTSTTRVPWRHPIVLAFGAWLSVLMCAAAFAIAPYDAWFGAYARQHGTASWLALAVLFLAACDIGRSAAGRDRIVAAVALGSIWPSLYALMQAASLDPVTWTDTIPGRAGSTSGNPILLGGYLAVAIPFTAAAAWRWRPLALCLLLQIAALVATGSRGPLLAAGAAAAIAAVTLLYTPSRARLAAGLAAVTLVAAVTLALVPDLRPAVLGRAFDAQSGSGRVRILIWSGISGLMRDAGARAWMGYGPESLRLTFPPFYSAEIRRIEMTDAMPDRGHNEILDTLVGTGLIGVACEGTFFGLVIAGALRTGDRRWRAALLAAAAAHLLEIQLGIATVTSRLLFVVAAALVVRAGPAAADAQAWPVPWRVLGWSALAGAATPVVATVGSALAAGPASGDESALAAQLWRVSLITVALYALVLAAVVATARVLGKRAAQSPGWRRPVLIAAACAAAVPLSITPSRADVMAKAGSSFVAQQQWPEAVVAYTTAARLQPRVEAYWTALGRALMQDAASGPPSRFDQARAALERAETLNARDPLHPRNLGNLWRTAARRASGPERDAALAEADHHFERAARLAPGLPGIWTEWGNLEAERRRFPEALVKLDHALALDAAAPEPWLLRGLVHSLNGDHVLALQDYDRALALNPDSLAALRGRAVALAEAGRLQDLPAAIDDVLRRAPQDAVALRLRAKLRPAS